MQQEIKNLTDLQEEKKRLQVEMQIAKREFVRSFGDTQAQTKDFLLKKVALPSAAIGIAKMGINRLLDNNSSSTKEVQAANQQLNNKLLFKLIPVVIPIIQSLWLDDEDTDINVDWFLEQLFAFFNSSVDN